MFKVLSIDWDYFFDCTMEDRLDMFPDGADENISGVIQNVVWSTHYNSYDKLVDVGVSEVLLEHLKIFISNTCDSNTKGMYFDSHKHLYEAIMQNTAPSDSVEVINIDFHHDAYSGGLDDVDCGNWVNCLGEKRALKYKWVKRWDSDLDMLNASKAIKTMTITSLDKIIKSCQAYHFDMIYLCRSSPWSPPHLDGELKEFYDYINKITPLTGETPDMRCVL